MVRPLKQNEIPLIPINPSLTFKIWVIYLVGSFPRPRYTIGAIYIIITVEYVTKWEEEDL